jgi:uncharacterized BrkB/YihY/UPF0761 family membrane protein
VALLIWAGMAVIRALRLVSRLAWGMPKLPTVNMLLASVALAGLMSSFLVMQWAMGRLYGGPTLTDGMVFMINACLTAALFLFGLAALPRPAEVQWTALIPGGVLITVGFIGIRVATILYFAPRLESAGDLYGGLGLAAVFLAWLYIISRTVVAAISLNATIAQKQVASEPTTL